jgi:hypothetical protein
MLLLTIGFLLGACLTFAYSACRAAGLADQLDRQLEDGYVDTDRTVALRPDRPCVPTAARGAAHVCRVPDLRARQPGLDARLTPVPDGHGRPRGSRAGVGDEAAAADRGLV